jgi:hypothetical protein
VRKNAPARIAGLLDTAQLMNPSHEQTRTAAAGVNSSHFRIAAVSETP